MAYHDPKSSLYKSKEGAIIGGVCSGLSEKFRIDVTVIRIIFAALIFAYSAGFWLYLILWMFLPNKEDVV